MSHESLTFDVVVVGSGVIGLAVARAITATGRSVACVGPHHSTAGTASSAAGAMLGALGEVTAAATGRQDMDELRFRIEAAQRYPRFLDGIAADTGSAVFRGTGTVVVANLVNELDRRNLAAMADAAVKFGLATEELDPEDVPGLRPARGDEPVAARYIAEEGWVDSADLLGALRSSLNVDPRCLLIDGLVRRVVRQRDRITGVELDSERTVEAGAVVLAAGSGVQALLDGLGVDVPVTPKLLPGKGVSVRVTDVGTSFEQVIRTPNRDFACGTHVVPRADGSLYIGATNRISATPGSGGGVTPGELHALFGSAIHEINTGIRTGSVVETAFGYRPLSTDRYPLLGRTSLSGLLVATGTYRNGVLMAPLIADIIAAELDSPGPVPDNPFSPGAGFRTGTVPGQEALGALEEGMRDLISFVMEPGGHLPYDRYRELRAFLLALGRGAVADEPTTEFRRIRELLREYPIAEIVPQLFYEVSAASARVD